MAWHTIADAVALTGRSRRSIYRDMDAGRVSYRMGAGDRRELETSELMRAYGDLKPVAHDGTQPVAHAVTPGGTHENALLEAIERLERTISAQQAVIERNTQEIIELRSTLLRIEHKPDVPVPPEPKAEQITNEWFDLVDALRKR